MCQDVESVNDGRREAKRPVHAECSLERVEDTEFIDQVMNKFGQLPRHLKFLFKQWLNKKNIS